ncbi:hypothetical protein HHX47_DHR6000138 [Lentinula edodes]|nr:hypothetical protein HHX47_DHR6000138 [Lentinula edodes]
MLGWLEHLGLPPNVRVHNMQSVCNSHSFFHLPEDNILSEARNLRYMSIAQTPLLGEENTPMHTNTGGGTGFESATPRHQVAFTPNPLATPIRSGTGDVSATPRDMSVGSTPLRTPWRDNLSINPDGFPSIGDTPREQRLQAHSAKRALQTGFMNLPKPENNFELLVPEEENEGGDGEERGLLLSEEDAEERDAKLRRAREEEEKRILSRRTQVVRLGLPLPANFDAATLLEHLSRYDDVEEGELGAAQKLGDAELASLIQHDSLEHPIPGTSRPGGAKSTYEIPNDESIHAAKSLIHLELASLVGFPEANVDQVREGLIALSKADSVDDHASWASVRQSLTFDSSSKTWVNHSQLSSEQRIAGYDALLSEHQNTMGQEAQKIAKHEKKLGKVLGGYQARSQAISKRVTDAFAELQTTYSNYQSFVRLQTNEAAVGPRRVDTLKEEVENLERREKTLQERYAELAAERKESEAKVTALEEKLMAEAEKFNEASLAEKECRVIVFLLVAVCTICRRSSGIVHLFFLQSKMPTVTFPMLIDVTTTTIFPSSSTTPTSSNKSSTSSIPIAAIAGGVTGGAVLAVAIVIAWIIWG